MSEARFAKGPWQATDGETTGRKVIAPNETAKARRNVAYVGGHLSDANAALIAAAPDLYAALTYALRELRLVVDGSVGGVPNAIYALIPEAINKGEAALSRARGE